MNDLYRIKRIKNSIVLLFILLYSSAIYAQEYFTPVNGKLVKDFDGDLINDSVYIENSMIICRLSSHAFKEMRSEKLEITENTPILFDVKRSWNKDKKDLFCFQYYCGEDEYRNTFHYNKEKKRIQLIGISNGANSIDLLTNDYFGYFSFEYSEFNIAMKIPPIKTKMSFPNVYIENFSKEINIDFKNRSTELFYEYRDRLIKKYENSGDPYPFMYISSEVIIATDTLALEYETITENKFIDLKSNQKGYTTYIEREQYDTVQILETKHVRYKLNPDKHYYAGYLFNRYHAIIICGREVCETILLDNETNEVFILPSNDDTPSIISTPENGKRLLFYSTAVHYLEEGDPKSEITICEMSNSGGPESFGKPMSVLIYDWYIEDLFWIDDSNIVLKIFDERPEYQENQYKYKYLIAKVK